jgi:hypothetical protein
VKRFVAVVLGLLLASVMPAPGMAKASPNREAEMAKTVRGILKQTRDPRQVADRLSQNGARFLGYQQTKVTFVYDGKSVVPAQSATVTVNPDFSQTDSAATGDGDVGADAGQKTDLTMTMWLYEWQNSDRTYTEQAILSGQWSNTEYWWLDDPADVIDVRWLVGDLVMLSSSPYDGVQRDQQTQGIASFTVDDQADAWDLFVNFRPASTSAYGKWTNLFFNYTHTWWGARLSITLGQGQTGSTGSITITTDARQWVEGNALAFQIASGRTRGPVYTSLPDPQQ